MLLPVLLSHIGLCYNTARWILWVEELGRGATVAQRTLNPFILVRIRAPQPDQLMSRNAIVIDEHPAKYLIMRSTW